MFSSYGDYMNRRVNKLDCCCEKGDKGDDGKHGNHGGGMDISNGFLDLSCSDISNVKCIKFCNDIKIYPANDVSNSVYIGYNVADCSNHDLSRNSISIGTNVRSTSKSVIIACSGDQINSQVGEQSVAIGIDVSGGKKNVILGCSNEVFDENIAIGHNIQGGLGYTIKGTNNPKENVNNNIILNVSGSSVQFEGNSSLTNRLELDGPLGSDISGTFQVNPIRYSNIGGNQNIPLSLPLYYNPWNQDNPVTGPLNTKGPRRKEVFWGPFIIPRWKQPGTTAKTHAIKTYHQRALDTSNNKGIYVVSNDNTKIGRVVFDSSNIGTNHKQFDTDAPVNLLDTSYNHTKDLHLTSLTYVDQAYYKVDASMNFSDATTSNSASINSQNINTFSDTDFIAIKPDQVDAILFDKEGKFVGYKEKNTTNNSVF
jgi:hypothetical protein